MSIPPEAFESLEYGPGAEDPGPALRWLDERGNAFGHFVAGAFTDPSAGDGFETVDPATLRLLARVLRGTAGDVDQAVGAAASAQPAWWALGPRGRARHLVALARVVETHARQIAILESLDSGRTLREARDVDIPLVAHQFRRLARWAQLLEEELPGRKPLGVSGQILSWRSPLLNLAGSVAPALASGNTVVLKPSEATPLTALRFAELCLEVGLPPGVVNVITGESDTGAALATHPDVDGVAFTGSPAVGRILREATAGRGTRLDLELASSAPFVVFEDADLDSVVEGAVEAVWSGPGRVGCAGARILAQEGIAGVLEGKLRARMEALRVGSPLDSSVDLGAIVSATFLERIRSAVQEAQAEGVHVWQPSLAVPEEGWFYPPTLCTEVASAHTMARREVPGPVAVLMTFRTPEEAVAMASRPRVQAASVWSQDIDVALEASTALKAGAIWVNRASIVDATSGFGGSRGCGFGREGGREGLRAFMKPKAAAAPPETPGHLPQSGGAAPPPAPGPEDGAPRGELAPGVREDVDRAVAAARRAQAAWAARSPHHRARVLGDLAEILEARADELIHRLALLSGDEDDAGREVAIAVARLFTYGAWADMGEGTARATPPRNLALAVHEPLGVMGAVCPDERPLLGLISCVAPLVGVGNTCVVIPSPSAPALAKDVVQVMETSDLPGGVVSVVSGTREDPAMELAAHDDVDGIWYFGPAEGAAAVERASVDNMKQTWIRRSASMHWMSAHHGQGEEFLRRATRVKHLWIPYGA